MDTETHPAAEPDSVDIDAQVRALLRVRIGSWPQIAERADVSHSWISQFMRGRIPNAGVATLRKVRDAILATEARAA